MQTALMLSDEVDSFAEDFYQREVVELKVFETVIGTGDVLSEVEGLVFIEDVSDTVLTVGVGTGEGEGVWSGGERGGRGGLETGPVEVEVAIAHFSVVGS